MNDKKKLIQLLESFSIAVGFTFLVLIPINMFVSDGLRILSFLSGSLLWYLIIFHNDTFRFLLEKWFGKPK